MFWRLFLTYLLFVALAGGAVAAVGTRADTVGVALAIAGVAATAAVPAYLLARRFTRPLDALTGGAQRLADGDLGHRIFVEGGREFTALARTFNGMSLRLAESFAQVERDRQQLLTVLSGMVEGVVAVDHDERVLFANERAGELLEFPPEAAVGRLLVEVTRQAAVRELVEKALAADDPHRRELDWKGRTLAVYVSRLPGPADSPGAVLVLHDMTDLRRLEKMRQEFVANVSHELKTPLAVIRSNIEALADGAADDPVLRVQFLDRVVSEADRLGLLIQDLLRLARIESGDQLLDLGPVPLDRAIAECLDRHATRAEDKTLRLVEVPPADFPASVAAWADNQAIDTILDNLIDNAIKYTGTGGKVAVRWGATADRVRVQVEDTGPGIAAKDLPRVFERFYRVDKARRRDAGGTGLGLAIVKHLVQAMNGTIAVASTVGQGTTFTVTLPRADATG
jgi:two-component system phosphate regulon sensor histidine kinase PhoR